MHRSLSSIRRTALLALVLALISVFGFAAGRLGAEGHSSAVPRRIVAMAPSTAEIICELGACPSIVGVSKFCVYPPELKSRTQVGGLYDADLEGIAALRPDLLITRGRHESLERLAERLKIRLYRDETDSLEGIERTVLELGSTLQQDEKARSIVQDFRDHLSGLRAANTGKKKVLVLLTVSRNPQRLANILTAGRGSFLDEMIEVAGGVNVFGSLDMRYPEVSVESIIAKQPEYIVELMPEVDVASNANQIKEQWATLSSIPAVRANQIYILDDENSLIPSLRYVEFIEKVSRIIHSTETTK